MSKTIDGAGGSTSTEELTIISGSTSVHIKATPGGTDYNFNLPDTAGTAGQILTSGGGGNTEMGWTSASFGTGTVTSVGATVPAFLNVSGTPITTTGTLAFGLTGTPLPVTSGGTGTTTSTGTGDVVLSNNPVMDFVTMSGLILTNPLGTGQGGTGTTTATGSGSNVLSTAPTITGGTLNGPTINSSALTGTTGSSGVINVSNTTSSTSTGTGALTVAGGVGIVGDLNVGGTITGTVVPGSINTGGTITTTNATQSTTPTNGAIVASVGGLGVAGNIIGGAALIGNRTSTTTLQFNGSGGTTILTNTSSNNISIGGGLGQTLQLPAANTLPLEIFYYINNNSSGNITVTNASAVTQTVIPSGGMIVATLFSTTGVNGIWDIHYFTANANSTTWGNATLTTSSAIINTNPANSTVSTNGALVLSGGAGIGGNVFAGGGFVTTFNTNSTSVGTGSIRTDGGLSVVRDSNLGGALGVNRNGTGGPSNQIRISPSSNGQAANIAYYENTNESGNAWAVGANIGSSGNFGFFYTTWGAFFTINGPTGNINLTTTTDSTSPTTGSITTAGGLGVAKTLYTGGGLNVNLSNTSPNNQIRIFPAAGAGARSDITFNQSNTLGVNEWVLGHNLQTAVGTFSLFQSTQGQIFTVNDTDGYLRIPKILIPSTTISNNVSLTPPSVSSITPINPGLIITLPNATLLTLGAKYYVNQPGTVGGATVKDFAGNTIVPTIPSGGGVEVVLTNNSTSAGAWNRYSLGSTYLATDTEAVVGLPLQTPSISTNSGLDLFTYSTGLWTPTLDGSVSYTTQTGKYVQSGIEVKVAIRIIFDVLVSGTALKITNLPFTTAASGGIGFGIIGQGGMTGIGSVLVARGTDSTTDLEFFNPLDELPIILDNTWPTVTIEGLVTYFV